jgi:hypothetical protein
MDKLVYVEPDGAIVIPNCSKGIIGQLNERVKMNGKNGDKFYFERCTDGNRLLFYLSRNGSGKITVEGCKGCPYYTGKER